jgi:hypothetical protein
MTSSAGDNEPPRPKGPPWKIGQDFHKLHEAIIWYGVEVHKAASSLQQKSPHLSYQALAILHMRALTIHRAVRDLCELGWTPVTSILIRTLLDLYANMLAIVINPVDVEFMAFRYLLSFPISKLTDPSASEDEKAEHRNKLDADIPHLPKQDQDRARKLIEEPRRISYWYQPEFASPSALLNKTKGEMQFVYRVLSGSVHGGTVGLGFLDDAPDDFDINQREHPRRTPIAIAMCSRLTLELAFLRDQAERTGLDSIYYKIKDNMFLPLRPAVEGGPGTK